MADENKDNPFSSEDLEELTSAESLDPLGELQSENTAPKPQVPKGSSSKRKATLPNVSATSKPRAHSHTQHEAVMEGLKTLQDQQTASLASLGTAITGMVSTVKEFIHSSGSGTSRKRKRDELSESDADEHEIDDEIESIDVDEAYKKLVSEDKTPEKPAEDEDNVLAELSKIYDSEGAVSDPVSSQLANLVDKMVKTMLSEDNAKEKLGKYNRPQNCENLVSTRVNPEIWAKMRSSSKSRDLKMQKIETSMLKSMHPIISLTDKLLALKSKPQNISKEDVSCFLRFTLDSLTLMSHSVYEANLVRRELIRPDLNEHYKQLCSSQTPISKFLFGDDLPKAVKEISETNKVSQRVSHSKHGTFSKHGSNNFKRQGSYPNRQNHFLFQGQGQRRKPPSKFKTQKGARVEHTK